MRMLPNMTVMAPATGGEMDAMLRFALDAGGPVAVRFPRGEALELDGVGASALANGQGEVVKEGDDVALFALGDMVAVALEAAGLLAGQGVAATVVNARFAKPIDEGFVGSVASGKKLIVTLEDNVVAGGYGSGIESIVDATEEGARVLVLGLPDSYIEHGSIPELLEQVGLSAGAVASRVLLALEG